MNEDIFSIGFIILLSSCQTVKYITATGGSKADATVKLSYQYGQFDQVKIDTNHAIQIAIKRCSVWGYTSAEAFGGSTSICQEYNRYGNCVRTLVTTEYQCIGNTNE